MWINVNRTVIMSMGHTSVPAMVAMDLTMMNSTVMVSVFCNLDCDIVVISSTHSLVDASGQIKLHILCAAHTHTRT